MRVDKYESASSNKYTRITIDQIDIALKLSLCKLSYRNETENSKVSIDISSYLKLNLAYGNFAIKIKLEIINCKILQLIFE